jgi:hypothetical protein
MNLIVPSQELPANAAVFEQSGRFVMAGDREACEQRAIEIGGLYCWIINGRPVVRSDFQRDEEVT